MTLVERGLMFMGNYKVITLCGSVKPHDVTNMPRTTKVLYLCDQKACKNCSYPECRHTHDIEHAISFDNVSSFNASLEPLYVENSGTTIYFAPARGNGKTDKLIKWLKGD
jgi:hypothetical protein